MTDKASFLIRFEKAWFTGYPLPTSYRIGDHTMLCITLADKNPDGDGYFVSGYIDFQGTFLPKEVKTDEQSKE
jgi:hypothetical protein